MKNSMILPIIGIFLFFILFFIPIHSKAMIIPESLTGTFHNSQLFLEFSNGKVSGTLNIDNNIINIDNIKVIEKKDRFYILDKQNNLKILSKQISQEKYLVLVKTNSDTKLRFVTDSSEPTKKHYQRNLFDEMNEKQMQLDEAESKELSFKEQQLQEKQDKLAETLKKFKDSQEKTTEQKKIISNSEKTREDILADFEKSKIITGMGLVEKTDAITEKKATKTDTTTQNIKIKAFLSLPHSVQWKKELVYDVLVTDDSGHRYNPNYNDYVGNELEDVSVTGKIINPSGETMESFSGVTDSNGNYINRFQIPDNSPTRGEYTVQVNASYTLKDEIKSESGTSKIFFVLPAQNNSFNDPPIADAGIDGHYASGSTVTLDGSNSTDTEKSILYYTWSQTDGTKVMLDSNKTKNSTSTFTMLDEFGTFVFSLLVNDGYKDSLEPDTVTITSLHAEAGENQTRSIKKITLDGSGSGTALPNNDTITYSWTFFKVPTDSEITIDDLSNANTNNPTFTPDIIGNYILKLNVTDDKIFDTDVVNVKIKQ